MAGNNFIFENKNIFICDRRVDSRTSTLENLTKSPYDTARIVAKAVGKIMSTIFVLRNIVRLKTRYLYKCICAQNSWDSHFNILYYHYAFDEIIFWKNNVKSLNKKLLFPYKLPVTKVYSDASNSGIGACFTFEKKKYFIHKNFSEKEKIKSSTWRELEAIYFSLVSLPNILNGNTLFWHTDNFAAAKIVESGSNKPELQTKAIEIFHICKMKNINLKTTWISREYNKEADLISKSIDHDDWTVTHSVFEFITKKWGNVTIDRFASHRNNKKMRPF